MLGLVDETGPVASGLQRRLDRRGVGIGSVRRQAEPERQATRPPSEVMGVVRGVPASCRAGVVPIVVKDVEVLGMLGVGVPGDLRVAIHQGARVERSEQPFVRIDDEAVGALHAGEEMAHTGGGEAGAPVGAVDVEPGAETLRRIGGGSEVVDDAGVRRPRRGDDGEHSLAILVGEVLDGGVDGRRREPAALVGRGEDEVGVHRPGGLGDRRVRPVAADDQASRAVVGAASVVSPLPAGGQQRRQVAGRAAADEHASGLGGKAGEVGDPAQRLVLGEHRAGSLDPRAGVDARRPDDKVEQDRRLGGRRRHEREVAWVVGGDARRGEHLAEDAQGFQPANPRRRDRTPDHRSQLGGRSRMVERRRLHPHAVDGVAHDRLREHFTGAVVAVHRH